MCIFRFLQYRPYSRLDFFFCFSNANNSKKIFTLFKYYQTQKSLKFHLSTVFRVAVRNMSVFVPRNDIVKFVTRYDFHFINDEISMI